MFVAVTGLPNAARIVVLADSLRLGRMEATSNDGRVCASTLDIPRARVTAMTVALRCDVGTEPSSADDYRVLSGRLHARALTGEQNHSSRHGLACWTGHGRRAVGKVPTILFLRVRWPVPPPAPIRRNPPGRQLCRAVVDQHVVGLMLTAAASPGRAREMLGELPALVAKQPV